MAGLALSCHVLGELRLYLLEASLLLVVAWSEVVLRLVSLGGANILLSFLGSESNVLVHSSLGLQCRQDWVDPIGLLPEVVLNGVCLGVVLDLVHVVLARCLHSQLLLLDVTLGATRHSGLQVHRLRLVHLLWWHWWLLALGFVVHFAHGVVAWARLRIIIDLVLKSTTGRAKHAMLLRYNGSIGALRFVVLVRTWPWS